MCEEHTRYTGSIPVAQNLSQKRGNRLNELLGRGTLGTEFQILERTLLELSVSSGDPIRDVYRTLLSAVSTGCSCTAQTQPRGPEDQLLPS